MRSQIFFNTSNLGTFEASLSDPGAADSLLLTLDPQLTLDPFLSAGEVDFTADLTGGFDFTATGGGGLIFNLSAASVPEPNSATVFVGLLAAISVLMRSRRGS